MSPARLPHFPGATMRVVSQRLEWHETASGLIYEAAGDSGRRFIVAADGRAWTLDLFIDSEYESAPVVDPAPAATIELAQQLAQEWESACW